jgi:hypothetical protein
MTVKVKQRRIRKKKKRNFSDNFLPVLQYKTITNKSYLINKHVMKIVQGVRLQVNAHSSTVLPTTSIKRFCSEDAGYPYACWV